MFHLNQANTTTYTRPFGPGRVLKSRGLAATTAAGLLLLVSPLGLAQDSASERVLEEVVVKGYSRSLGLARDIKRDADQFKDAIVAEDIGKLPDANVAESLQRVSGVQLDRGIGEGTAVSIRGFRDNITLVNGREVIQGGGRGSRGPDTLATTTYSLLTLVPPEMISRLEVTKQAGADEIEGAVGGIINIITRKPMDHDGLQASGTLSAGYGELSGEPRTKASFLISNTFADDRFGVLLNATFDDREVREDGFNTFSGIAPLTQGLNFTDPAAGNAVFDPAGLLLNPDPNGDGRVGLYHQEPRVWQIDDERERTGLNLIAQWQPNDTFELVYDALISDSEAARDRHWLGTFVGFARINNAVLSPNEFLISGTSIREPQTNLEFFTNEQQLLTQSLAANWDVTDRIAATFDVSLTNAESSQHQSFARLLANNPQNIDFDFTPEVPAFRFDPSVFDELTNLNLFQFNDNESETETDYLAVRLDFDHTLNDNIELEYGARVSRVESTLTTLRDATVRPRTPADQLSNFIGTWNSPDFFSGEMPGLPRSYPIFDSSFADIGFCTAFRDFFLNHPDPAQTAAYTQGLNGQSCTTSDHIDPPDVVDEDFKAVYAKLNFFGDIGDTPISGNFGLRVINRDLESTGTRVNPDGTRQPITTTTSDNEVLPSAVVKLDLTENFVARFGVARVLSYPGTGSLRNRLAISGDGSGSAGSPGLEPFKANQFDLSLEYYFSDDGLISLGYFSKDIDSFIVSSTDIEVIPGYVNPNDGSNTALIRRDINGDGGTVDGFELLYQQDFTFLPEPFDGLGVMATYSFIDSETPFEDIIGNQLPLPGLSENNVNLVAYWEKGPFGVRLSYNWRDDYLDRLGNSGSGVFAESYQDLQFGARWDISERFSLDLQATNLLDERLRLYNTFEEATRSIVEFGPAYVLAFRGSL